MTFWTLLFSIEFYSQKTTLVAGARLKDQRRWVDVQNKQANKKGHHKLSQNNHVSEKTTLASGRN